MDSVSRFWLRAVQGVSILLVLLVGVTCITLHGAAAEADTQGTDRADGRQQLITVTADGKSRNCLVSGQVTVREQLVRLDIELEQMDTVNLGLETVLSQGDAVKVSRNRVETVEERGVIAHKTVYEYSPNVTAGTEQVVVQGQDGYGIRTYEVLLADGVEQKRTLVSENIEEAAVTKKIETGFRSPLISPFNFDWTFDENGEPIGAEQVLRGQRSSAYSARVGAKTASGRDAIVGHVAVNPNVIPYGSKLFIQSNNGKYIYGYAIAADTGTALMDGRVAVDIFYGSYQESVNHGIIEVDIFVLE